MRAVDKHLFEIYRNSTGHHYLLSAPKDHEISAHRLTISLIKASKFIPSFLFIFTSLLVLVKLCGGNEIL